MGNIEHMEDRRDEKVSYFGWRRTRRHETFVLASEHTPCPSAVRFLPGPDDIKYREVQRSLYINFVVIWGMGRSPPGFLFVHYGECTIGQLGWCMVKVPRFRPLQQRSTTISPARNQYPV